jgi:AbrB family looped-hinge helix DNA binding protein
MQILKSALAKSANGWDASVMSDTKVIEVGPKGRVVIPVAVRRQLGIETGTRLAVLVNHGAVVLVPREAVESRLHAMFKGVQTSLADELMEERRAEATRDQRLQ